jgi:hypothetical protein
VSERNLLKKHDHGSSPHPANGPGLRDSTLKKHDGLTKAVFLREGRMEKVCGLSLCLERESFTK